MKRIQRPLQRQRQKYKEPSPEASASLNALLGRMEARQWKEETLQETVQYIRQSAFDIKLIQHLRICERCRIEAIISVERYGGRCLTWFLDLVNDVNECAEGDPRYAGCPRFEDYKIGSYWDQSTDFDEIWRFIMDRCSWAEKLIRQEIVMATRFYKRLKAWDLNTPPPTEENLPF